MGPYMVSAVVKGPVELAAHAAMAPSNEYFLFSPFPSFVGQATLKGIDFEGAPHTSRNSLRVSVLLNT